MHILFGLAVLATFSLAGCGGSDSAPPTKSAPAKAADKLVAAAPKTAGNLMVSILPEPATADGCIKALVSGLHQATYAWEVNGQEVGGQAGSTLCEGFRRGDEVKVIASDGQATGSFSFTIANAPPRITEVAVNANAVSSHADIVIKPTVIDIDDDPIEVSYQWFINGEADPFLTERTLPAGRYARGDQIRFTIVASDGVAEGKLYQSDALTIPNAPPQILSQPPQQFEALEYRYQVKARDPDGDKLVYVLTKAPQGMTVNRASGLIAWPLAGVQPGTYPLRVVVRDPDGAEAFQEFSMTLGAQPPATAPPAGKP